MFRVGRKPIFKMQLSLTTKQVSLYLSLLRKIMHANNQFLIHGSKRRLSLVGGGPMPSAWAPSRWKP